MLQKKQELCEGAVAEDNHVFGTLITCFDVNYSAA